MGLREAPSGLVLIANGVDPMLRWGSPGPTGTGRAMQYEGPSWEADHPGTQ